MDCSSCLIFGIITSPLSVIGEGYFYLEGI
ncbi:hypothetical protein [Klebsiella phage 05F01]|nr:hypothetical protein [Klebsiella phage 05F01]